MNNCQATITNNGTNGAGQLNYSVVIQNASISNDDGTATWSSTRTRTWVEGQETGFFTLDNNGQWMGLDGILDDVWEITGNGTGNNRDGRDYTVDITTALRVQWCGLRIAVTEGVIEIAPEDLKVRTVDFGSGQCDSEFTVTIGNKEYTVSSSGS